MAKAAKSAPKSEPAKPAPGKAAPAKAAPAKADAKAPKADKAAKTAAPKAEPVKAEAPKAEPAADAAKKPAAPRLRTPSDLDPKQTAKVSDALNGILADAFALYIKTKNFHWHISGPHFRDYHLLLDEQADQIYAMTDPLAERIRKIGGTTLRSIGHINRLQSIKDNDETYVDALAMLGELQDDNKAVAARMRKVHDILDKANDIASASLIENWIDETERRTWFLYEASRESERTGH
jgi:starvation-inducible DNA-binding protein